MSSATPALSSTPRRPRSSCICCAKRKVKCDRKSPCEACLRHKVVCVFDSSQPPQPRRKRGKDNNNLVGRLQQCEALLQERGVDPNTLPRTPYSQSSLGSSNIPKEPQVPTPVSIELAPSRPANEVQPLQNQHRFKFADNLLWTRVAEEFHEPQDASVDSFNEVYDSETSEDDADFVLGTELKSNARLHHPPPEVICQLWQTFTENVDPLIKIIHIPTIHPAIQRAAGNVEAIPRSFEALMFAIYSAAVMSLADEECTKRLCEPRKVLLSRYVSATRKALSRAKFMGTTNLVVLQALVLHLLSVRDIYEPRAIWSLTGVAVRIAQGIGLERDGEHLGLPPFETEIRRRVWWALKSHDFRTGELCGIAKFHDLQNVAESTKWPTSINDDQLYLGMPSISTISTGLTDISAVALKCELLNIAATRKAAFQQQGKDPGEWELHTKASDADGLIELYKSIEELLETKYLRYCDPSQPLHLMVMLLGRCSLNTIRFLSHHPRRWPSAEQTSHSERELVWRICINLLEQHDMLQSNPLLKRFAWHGPYIRQWHAIIHILDTLQANPLRAEADKAWQLVGRTYENTPEMTFDMRKPINVAVGNLCLKAYSAREVTSGNVGKYVSAPHFIVQLRQHLESLKAKRQARHANRQTRAFLTDDQINSHKSATRLVAAIVNPVDTLQSTPQQYTEPGLSDNTQTDNMTTSPTMEEFWCTFGLNGDETDGMDNGTNMNLDFMLDQDYNFGNTAQPITWDQWDSWLAESNALLPQPSGEDFGWSI